MRYLLTFLLLSAPVMAHSQAWVKTPDGMKRLGMTSTISDTAVVSAQASVDSTVFVTRTNLDSVKANRAYTNHTHPGGSAYWTDLRRTAADTANSSNTAVTSIGGLEFSASAATRYEFEFYVMFASAATTTGIVLGVQVSSAPTAIAYTVATPIAADGAAAMFHGWGTASNDLVVGTAVQATNTTYMARVWGYVLTNSAATISARFRSEINGSAITVRTNSWGRYRAIP